VLNIPADQIHLSDHFFERGGTSLSAVRMAIALDRLVSPGDVARFPVLADMAVLLEERVRKGSCDDVADGVAARDRGVR
jgi:hypothetical protein